MKRGGTGRPEARRLVVALGGNAILQAGQRGTAAEQLANIRKTCQHIAGMIAAGHQVTITHGNGPQVGNILLQNEEASRLTPPMPLDVCGAQSQGMMGYMIQHSLSNELCRCGIRRTVATVVTRVLVDPADPAFRDPSKPIGPYYTEDKARELMSSRGWAMKEIDQRGWRRVVPSPAPLAICEREAILKLLSAGVVVVASGGGGIPVQAAPDGELVGMEAVVDKDLAGQRLACDVHAEVLMILTDVERVAVHFGRPEQRDLGLVKVKEMRAYLEAGQFPPGSMGPKVTAACRFVEEGGEKAIIASLDSSGAALRGEAGTIIVP